MSWFTPRVALFLFLLLSPGSVLAAGTAPFVHLQADRTSYRLGETIWFRAHSPGGEPVTVTLITGEGGEAARALIDGSEEEPFCGRFPVPLDLEGGPFRLQARVADVLAHEVGLRIYDLAVPRLDLDLVVIGEAHYPGQPLAATFLARDRLGRPVKGARVQYRAVFGPVTLRGSAGETDDEGRALLRLALPAKVRESGRLSVGLALPGREAAVSRAVSVAAPIARVDAFPEGGAVLDGTTQRFGLLVRDRNGDTAAASGRVVDREGRTVAGFRTGLRGLATVLFDHEAGQSYGVVIDQPAGVEDAFPLPGPGGHRFSMRVEEKDGGFQVEVRGRKGEAGRALELMLSVGPRIAWRSSLRLEPGEKGNLPTSRIEVPRRGEQGLGHLVLKEKGRVHLKRAVILGARSPITVTLKPKGGGPLLPGTPVDFELKAARNGQPVQADLAVSVFQGDRAGIQDLAARWFLDPGGLLGAAFPQEAIDGPEEREALLHWHQAFRFPAEGLPVEGSGLPDPAAGRLGPGSLAPPPPIQDDPSSVPEGPSCVPEGTVARHPVLDRLLERAHFTLAAVDEPGLDSFRPRVPPAAYIAKAGPGKRSALPPQAFRLSPTTFDSRRTLFWSGSVRTDSRGRAEVRFRLNHLVSELSWVAQGFAGEVPVGARGSVSPAAGFETRFEFPDHLQVGDFLDLMVEVRSRDPEGGLIDIELQAPSCLKPRLRTRLTFDPSMDARLQRFQFDATAPADAAQIRLVARRGLYEETRARPFRVGQRDVELTFGRSGRGQGDRKFSLTIPPDAVEGSVRARATVSPSYVARAGRLSAEMVRQPTGCFEQFTSTSGLNLAVLDALLEGGEDPLALERAFLFAREGYRRLLTHFEPASGGFSLWPGRAADLHATLVALRQLALYQKLAPGEGRKELEAALAWLGSREVPTPELLYVTLAVHDMGRAFQGSAAAARVEAGTLYEKALQAGCLASWPEKPPGKSLLGGKTIRERLDPLLDSLEEALDGNGPPTHAGTGIMGSTGEQLAVEVLALAAVAFHQAGREDAARSCLGRLQEREWGSSGTQGMLLAIRASARLTPVLPTGRMEVEFSPGSGAIERRILSSTRARPLVFERGLPVKPGSQATVALNVLSGEPESCWLALSYRVPEPRPGDDAPFRLAAHLTPEVDQGSLATLRLTVEPRRRTPSSQVVARIGLPAGITVERTELDRLVKDGEVSFFEAHDGYLDLYWARKLEKQLHLTVPVRAVVAGTFSGRPSFVYPYYESGKESFAAPLRVKVRNTHGATEEALEALRARHSGRGG